MNRDELEQLIDHNWRLWQLPDEDADELALPTALNTLWLKWVQNQEIPPQEVRMKLGITGGGGEGWERDTTPYWLEYTEEELVFRDNQHGLGEKIQSLIDRTAKVLNRGYRALVWNDLTPVGYIDELDNYTFHGEIGEKPRPWVATLQFKSLKTGEPYETNITAETREELSDMIMSLAELKGK